MVNCYFVLVVLCLLCAFGLYFVGFVCQFALPVESVLTYWFVAWLTLFAREAFCWFIRLACVCFYCFAFT